MATQHCINGHIYDPNVYGDTCPFCPSTAGTTDNAHEGHTYIDGASGETKPTIPMDAGTNAYDAAGGGTVIRHMGNNSTNQPDTSNGNRRLVGMLICYDLNPLGEAFKIYEGRNTIGRKATVDIVLSGDRQISSEHLIILYREAEGVFWAIDNNSSNGTFVNGNFENKVQLHSNDVITIGNTQLIFIAIPHLSK